MVTLKVNETTFTDNIASSVDGGAIYFSSTDTESSVNLNGVTFTNNLGAGNAANDIYIDITAFACVTKHGTSGVLSGPTGGSCTPAAATPAPTYVSGAALNSSLCVSSW